MHNCTITQLGVTSAYKCFRYIARDCKTNVCTITVAKLLVVRQFVWSICICLLVQDMTTLEKRLLLLVLQHQLCLSAVS